MMPHHVSSSQPTWPAWVMLVLFVFLAFECVLLAVAFQGSWLILLAPGFVCAIKGVEMWRELQRKVNRARK
jgi:hypothetical protein